MWVPAGVLCAAPRQARRRLLPLCAVGATTATALALALTAGPVTADIRGHTAGYVLDLPHSELLVAGYLLATVGSLLLSGHRGLLALGIVLGAGALLCWALWRLEFVSTWCAVAAVCSVALFSWVRRRVPETESALPGDGPARPGRRP